MIASRPLAWILPLLLTAPFLVLSPSIDLTLADYFYSPVTGTFSKSPFFLFFYKYGMVPGNLTAIAALFLLIGSVRVKAWRKWRRSCTFLILVMLIGPLLLVNVVLKDHWGRPRPKQIEQFGGGAVYRPFWKPDFSQKGKNRKSFPSGHASVGFYFLALIFVGVKERKRSLIIAGIVLASFLGLVLSATRIAMGGHFFSDVLMSGLLLWYVCLILDKLILCTD